MAQAILQMSCTKLRSAIALGDEATSDLQQMLEALEVIQPLLEDAERQTLRLMDSPLSMFIPVTGEIQSVRKWLKRVTSNAYDISDMVDDLEDARRTSRAAAKRTRIIPHRANAPKEENPMADRMKEMKNKLSNLRFDFNLKPSDPAPIINVPEVEEAIIVGRDKLIQSIMAKISAASDTSKGPIILKIGGYSGYGKTALAQMVFNDTRFKHYSRVWIHSTWKYRLHEIGKSIISQVSGEEINRDSNDMEYITKRLHQLLNGPEMLVVIDNLLLKRVDTNQLKHMLSVGDKGSKLIVIITHDENEKSCRPLSDDMCWTIIKQRSRFEDRSESDKQDLEQIGREIASKCEGLPLAAASLGGILRYKDAAGWAETVKSHLWEEPGKSPTFLVLAYTSMPPNLRLCFAYCAMFPKGHSIAKDDLIHQWIALGLLEQSDRLSAPQLGEQHIRMLLGMSLLTTIPTSRKWY